MLDKRLLSYEKISVESTKVNFLKKTCCLSDYQDLYVFEIEKLIKYCRKLFGKKYTLKYACSCNYNYVYNLRNTIQEILLQLISDPDQLTNGLYYCTEQGLFYHYLRASLAYMKEKGNSERYPHFNHLGDFVENY